MILVEIFPFPGNISDEQMTLISLPIKINSICLAFRCIKNANYMIFTCSVVFTLYHSPYKP